VPQVGVVSGRYGAGDSSSPLTLLEADAPSLLKASARQLSDKSLKTRIGMFAVLHTLVGVLPGSIADHVGMLVPGGCGGHMRLGCVCLGGGGDVQSGVPHEREWYIACVCACVLSVGGRAAIFVSAAAGDHIHLLCVAHTLK
jgi:hypothetical protein